MRKTKRFFIMLLTICIILGVFPVRVSASQSNSDFLGIETKDWIEGIGEYIYDQGIAGKEEQTTSESVKPQEKVTTALQGMEDKISSITDGFSDKGLFDTQEGGVAAKAPAANLLCNEEIIASYKTYTVTFMYNYDDKGIYKSMLVKPGEKVELSLNPYRSGFYFDGWYTEANGGAVYDFDNPVEKDTVLYAGWIDSSDNELSLSVNQNTVLITETDTMWFYLETDLVAEKIDLYDVSSDVQLIAQMYDDGMFSEHGDDIAGDGIYSAMLTGIPSEDITLSFAAKYEDKQSNVVDVKFYAPISDETLEVIEAVDNKILEFVDSAEFADMSDEEKKINADNLLSELTESDLIVDESVYYNEEKQIYSFEYADGIMGGIMIGDFEEDFNGATVNTELYENINSNVYTDTVNGIIGEEIGSALILNSFPSFETKKSNISYRTEFYEDLKNEWDDKGLQTTLDTNVTISDYQALEGYDVICISTHGSVYEWNDGFLWLRHHEYPAICLSEKSTREKDKQYSSELKDKQIVKVNGKYWILPAFFENEYEAGELNNTFIFSESCQFMGKNGVVDNSMAEALLSRSATAVVGFHNSVYATYSRELMRTYVNELMLGNTVQKAFDAAKDENGKNHKVWYEGIAGTGTYDSSKPVAYPILSGETEATLIQMGIINGDFELYDTATTAPSSWKTEGDVRTLAQLGEVKPFAEASKRMAIITTGVGSKTTATVGSGTEGSCILQKFVIPENVSTLYFEYNFISEEPMEYVGTVYNDAFGILLMQNDNVLTEDIFESINSSTWYEVDNINFAGGDSTVYQTGWKTAELDVSAYRGKIVTLYFIVYDVGDSIYDSACVIDNVELK